MFARFKMAEPAGKVLEGVFAIAKPPSLSSAQVLRDLQHAFKSSRTFRPLLDATNEQHAREKHRSKRRRIDSDNAFKMGHGGTLDPMATGVLIVGIGRGTKSLQDFLYCTKTYETVVLFGKSTDTYDVSGKVVASKPTSHINKQLIEAKLAEFRGRIKQVPPIYSALKINGMKAYEYARSGKELPRELEAREMEVSECSLIDWYEPGEHDFRWPAGEAADEDKKAFQRLAHIGHDTPTPTPTSESEQGQSRKEDGATVEGEEARAKEISITKEEQSTARERKATLHTHSVTGLSEIAAEAPAARIRLTVSSGFYVRSFAHDLGVVCNSYATMAELARTRQADFAISGSNTEGLTSAIDYEDIDKGEDNWGPKITEVLEKWLKRDVSSSADLSPRRETSTRQTDRKHDWRGGNDNRKHDRASQQKRRNSSSPDL